MLVYGDRSERVDAHEWLARIAANLDSVGAMRPGIRRHSQLVAQLIGAGRLLQAVADAEFDSAGHDRRTAATDALTAFLVGLGEAVWRSWSGKAAALPQVPVLSVRGSMELREPEGFAFYAVYPEAYAEAARSIAVRGPPCVIGVRSIGTSLGAIAAAAVGARLFVTVRPFGDPYARRIAIGSELERELLSQDWHFLIVDEGPGQSGSSFGAVADWLQERGVPLERIAFLPSHHGEPGRHANAAHRKRWRVVERGVADIAPRLPQLLADWASDLLGPLDGPLVDMSAGAWRSHVFSGEHDWPAVNPIWERRKYLAKANGGTWVLKFAGLGAAGTRKLAIAQTLQAKGLVPEPRGLLHGFLVEQWHEDAERLTPADRPLAQMARYLATRAQLLPAAETDGASLDALLEMSRRNGGLALGEKVAASLDQWEERLPSLSARVLRIKTDNRLDPHEWLRLADGTLLKSDALDHHGAHDLVGAQDVAWDVAGTSVEFGLDRHETEWLAAEVGRASGRRVDAELLQFMTIAYLAFRLGQARLSSDMLESDRAEQLRFAAAFERYERRLREMLLEQSHGSIPRKSALGLVAERTA